MKEYQEIKDSIPRQNILQKHSENEPVKMVMTPNTS